MIQALRVWPIKSYSFSVSYQPSGEELNASDEEPGLSGSDGCLEVFCQPAVAVQPSQGAFDHSSAR